MTHTHSCCAKTRRQQHFSKTGEEVRVTLFITPSNPLITQHQRTSFSLTRGIPLSQAASKGDCLGFGLTTRNLWLKKSSHMELPACLPTALHFARVGYDYTLKTGKSGYFSHRFSGKRVGGGRIGRNSSGFWAQNLINAPQTPMFTEGNVRLRIKCWVASHVSVNGHAISTEGIIEKWGSSRGFPLKK